MNITRENIDELNAILTVSIEKNDYEATVSDVLKNYRKKANMPGFRPGMVPAGLIKKMYGKAVHVCTSFARGWIERRGIIFGVACKTLWRKSSDSLFFAFRSFEWTICFFPFLLTREHSASVS